MKLKFVYLIVCFFFVGFSHAQGNSPQSVFILGAIQDEDMQKAILSSKGYTCNYIRSLEDQTPTPPNIYKIKGCRADGKAGHVCRGIAKCTKRDAVTMYYHVECLAASENECPEEAKCMKASYYDSAGISVLDPKSYLDQVLQKGKQSGATQ